MNNTVEKVSNKFGSKFEIENKNLDKRVKNKLKLFRKATSFYGKAKIAVEEKKEDQIELEKKKTT